MKNNTCVMNVGADFSLQSSTDRISRTQRTTSRPWRRNIQLQTILIIYERQQRKRISIRSNVTIQLDRHIFTLIKVYVPCPFIIFLFSYRFILYFEKKVYWAGPIVGGVVAALTYQKAFKARSPEEEVELESYHQYRIANSKESEIIADRTTTI